MNYKKTLFPRRINLVTISALVGLFISLVLPVIIIILVLIPIIKSIRKLDQRAEERLELEKKNMEYQQDQIEKLSKKIDNIEKILKDI